SPSRYCCSDHHDLHSFPTRRSSDLRVHLPFFFWRIKIGPSSKLIALNTAISLLIIIGLVIRTTPSLIACLESNDFTNSILSDSRSEEHTSELQSRFDLVCRLLLEKK